MHIVFVVENREQCWSCTGRTYQLYPPHTPPNLPFLSLYAWIGTVLFFMWVLAAAVVARRLLPKRTGPNEKKKYAKKKKKESVFILNKQQGHMATCDRKSRRNASETKIFFREAAESLDLH